MYLVICVFILQQWDQDLAEFAQQYADGCRFAHSSSADRMGLVDGFSWIGENLYVTSALNPESVVDAAIQAWYNEISDYDYDSNTCAPGKVCGHYTQVRYGVCLSLVIIMNEHYII